MKKVIRLTEADLVRLVKRIVKEQKDGDIKTTTIVNPDITKCITGLGIKEILNYPYCVEVINKVFDSGNVPTNEEQTKCLNVLNGKIPLDKLKQLVTCTLKMRGAKGLTNMVLGRD